LIQLRLEGRKKGRDVRHQPRFVVNALNVSLGQKEAVRCINPGCHPALRANFEHHIGFTEERGQVPESAHRREGQRLSEYGKWPKKRSTGLSFRYEDQAQALFDNYMKNATASV